jgi:hypothetical protein
MLGLARGRLVQALADVLATRSFDQAMGS